jgi:hypothetical protein
MAVYAVQAHPPQRSWCAFRAVSRLLLAPLQPPAAACPDAAAAQPRVTPPGVCPIELAQRTVLLFCRMALEAVTQPGWPILQQIRALD